MACRLNRLIRMIRLVNAKRYPNVQNLCQLFQIKERTLFNDLRELKEDLGVDIQFDRHRRGYYLANETNEISMLTLSERSAPLLLVAFALLQYYGDEALVAPLHDMFEQEFRLALHHQAGSATKLNELINVPFSKNAINERLFSEILSACLSGSPLRISSSNTAKRNGDKDNVSQLIEIYPSHLELSADQWHLAYRRADGTERLERMELSRIESISSELSPAEASALT